jgi:hypothetical protein
MFDIIDSIGRYAMSPEEKAEKDEVTINIGMPRPLHRRLSITCAVLDVSLKSALMAGASLWIDENAHAVASALPTPPPRTPVPPSKKSKGRSERGPEGRQPRDPTSATRVNAARPVNDATSVNDVTDVNEEPDVGDAPVDREPEDRLSAR